MRTEPGVLGVFTDPAAAAKAVHALREKSSAEIRASMPAPFPELVAALGRPPSLLGRVVLAAAVTGTLLGFALCIGTSLAWPLITGGKPIVSIPPYVIVGFELSVLIGGVVNLSTLMSLLAVSRRRRSVPRDPRFTVEHIGIFVVGGDAAAEAVLKERGAEEVRRVS
jgi:molybdopterin-containing oxidoreductase family membrane subunit